MSYSLKREIELYVNTVDSTDGVCKIAVLPEFELKVESNLLQVYRKIIGEDPEMLPRSGVDQISPVSLGFLTYIKPSMLDGLIGHTAPEKLFWDSLGGIEGYRGSEYYKVNFGRVNRLLPLYFFIKTTTAIYKVNKVYVDSVELSFDINYILTAKWTAQAISIDAYNYDEITFTNVKDYSNVSSYIRNKFTKLNITDSKDGKVYNFPITESSIKIQNTLMPVYDKNIKVVVGTVKDLIVGGRAVSGSFKSYLSGKFKHSRDFLDTISEDLTQVNRKYKIEYIAEDKYNKVSLTLPYAYINVPNLDFEDVLNVNIEFTSAESAYGANDDLDIRYISEIPGIPYNEWIEKSIQPSIYFKFNEQTNNSTIVNYGSLSNLYSSYTNLAITGGTTTVNRNGAYLNSIATKISGNFSSNTGYSNILKDKLPRKLLSSFFVKILSVSEFQIQYYFDFSNGNTHSVSLGINTQSPPLATIMVGYTGKSFTWQFNKWYHVAVLTDADTNTFTLFIDNVIPSGCLNASYSPYNVEMYTIRTAYYNGQFDIDEFILTEYKDLDHATSIVNTIYNIFDENRLIDAKDYYIDPFTEYNDSIAYYKGNSNAYYLANKKLGAVSYWRCNDNSNKEIKDHISDKTMAAIYNPYNGLEGPLINDSKSKAFRFTTQNSNQQYAYRDLNDIKCTGNHSWAFWVKLNEDPDGQVASLLMGDWWDYHSVPLFRHANKTFSAGAGGIYYVSGIPAYYWINSIGFWNLDINKWYFLTVTYDKVNNISKMYQDGILIATSNSSNVTSYANIRAIYINYITPRGYLSSDYYNNMDIAEISIFDYVLSDYHVKYLYYNSGIGIGFDISVEAVSNTIEINSYNPYIYKGSVIVPIKSSVVVNGNSLIGTNTTQVNPQNKLIRVRKYQKPIVKLSIGISPVSKHIVVDLNNTPIIMYGKRVFPSKGSVHLHKYNTSLIKHILPNYKHVYLIGKEFIINNTSRLIRPSKNSLSILGYTTVIKNTKSIKPTKGAIRISLGDTSLALYYKFNEISGTTLLDYSSFNRHATLYNTPTLNQSGPHATKKSIRFERASLEHAIYNSSISWPTEGSISLWIYPVTQQNYDMCFQFNHAFNQGNNINYFRFYRENSTNWWVMPFASGWNSNWQVTVNSGEWTHIAITWNSTANQLSVYKNGSIVINNGSHSSWPTSLQPLGICKALRDGTYHYWDGNISTFTLHNKRLNSIEVSSLYNNTYTLEREVATIYQRGHPITGHNTAVGYIPEVAVENITGNLLVQMIII